MKYLVLILFPVYLLSQEKIYDIKNPVWEYRVDSTGKTIASIPSADIYNRVRSVNKDPVSATLTVLNNNNKIRVVFMTNAVLEDGMQGVTYIQLGAEEKAKAYKHKGVPYDVDKSIYFLDPSLAYKLVKQDSVLIQTKYISQGELVFSFKVKGLRLDKLK